MVPVLISADEIKKRFSEYDPQDAGRFHEYSAKIADKEFAQALKISKHREVVLMSGGTASGKTEFVSDYFSDFDGVVLDGTLPSIEGAKIKIRKIIKSNKIPQIYAVIPDSLGRAFTAFLNRDRRFSEKHFYETHANSRKTLLWIAETYPEISIKIFESIYLEKGDMSFYERVFNKRMLLIEFLRKSQYTEQAIIELTNKLI